MAKLIAMAAVLASLACGSGANDAPLLGRATSLANAPIGAPPPPGPPPPPTAGPCMDTPEDCGVKVCVDCTANAPPGTEPACVASRCTFPCAAGFHKCGTECLPADSVDSCGSSCTPCNAPADGTPLCIAGACDFSCLPGFAKSGTECVSLSFSTSY